MPRCTRLEKSAYVLLILLAVVFMGAVTRDAWRMIGRPWTGFPVMENMLVGVGGTQRTAAEPFDLVRAVNGRLVGSSRELQQEVERHPAGTRLRYLLVRSGSLVEEEIASRGMSLRDFKRFVIDNLLSGILVLGLGAVVALLQPGARTTRLFLAFCLTTVLVNVGYFDLAGTHRFTKLFFLAWTLWPALFAHLALVFPERTAVARRWPPVVWVPYVLSAALWLWLQAPMSRDSWAATAGAIAIYWTAALMELLVSLSRSARLGATPLVRQRARVLLAGFGIGYLLPVLGTTAEVVLHEPIPYLTELWRLAFVFPLAVAYAIVRYQLFDIRAVVRAGTVYSVVTATVALGYAGLLAAVAREAAGRPGAGGPARGVSGRPRRARGRGGRAHRLPRAAHRAARAGAAPRRRAVHLGGAADLEDRCHPERGGPGARARLSRAAGRPAPRADPRVDPRRPVEVRAAHRAAADRAGARRPRAGETRDGRQRLVRRHRRLYPARRPPGRGDGGPPRGALLRRLPRRDLEERGRRQRDGGRRAHGHLPGRGPATPRPRRRDDRAGAPAAGARDQRRRAAGRADRAARRRELGPGGRGRDQDRGHGGHPLDLHGVGTGHQRRRAAGRAGRRRHPSRRGDHGTPALDDRARGPRRPGAAQRRGARARLPARADRGRPRRRLRERRPNHLLSLTRARSFSMRLSYDDFPMIDSNWRW